MLAIETNGFFKLPIWAGRPSLVNTEITPLSVTKILQQIKSFVLAQNNF